MIFGRKKHNIVEDVEGFTHSQRWTHMLALGRRAEAEPELREALSALGASKGFHPRQLALMAAHASGEAGIILACLTGASALLAGLALQPAARFLDDDTLAQALAELAPRWRLALADALHKRRRANVIDLAFPKLSAKGRLALLSFATPDFVRAQLHGPFAEGFSDVDWARIARRHPEIVENALAERLSEQAEPPTHLVASVALSIALLTHRAPQTALRLLRLAAGKIQMARLRYDGLAAAYPHELCALLLADETEHAARCPLVILRRVDDTAREALLRRDPNRLSSWDFARLAPDARRYLYEKGLIEHWRRNDGAAPIEIVAHLPQDARWREARRAYHAPQLASQPVARIPYLACLPLEEARDAAATFASQPDPDLRAAANAALIGCGRYAPSALPTILDYVETRRNEQDPVRLPMMCALADLPPSRWRDEHLAGIKKALDAARGARDVSNATLQAGARLLLRLAPFHTAFAGYELTLLMETLGNLPILPLEGYFTDAQMPAFAQRILPLLRLWRERSYNYATLSLIQCLGRRLKAAPALLDFLEETTRDPRSTIADNALAILARARAGRIDALAPRLLADDPGWIRSQVVSAHLHRKRQDLLTPFLKPRAYSGRFTTSQTKIVPSFSSGFRRWTARQQETYADSLLRIARDHSRNAWELRNVLATLATMPAIDPAPIEELASLDTKDAALRDTAVAALGRLDGARGVRTLVDMLADDRGRIAIYALRRNILDMRGPEAMALLRAAPMKKVTVAKEILRLVGDVEHDAAHGFITEMLRTTDLHRDIRIAALRALWAYLERGDSWDALAGAARDVDPAPARATIRIPQDRLSKAARMRLAQHMTLLLEHPSPLVRLDTLRRLVELPVAGDAALIDRLACALDQPTDTEVNAAAGALALCAPHDMLNEVAARFAAVVSPRAMQEIVGALSALSDMRATGRAGVIATDLVDALTAQRRCLVLATRLAGRVFAAPAFQRFVERLAAEAQLHPGAVMEAVAAAPFMAKGRRAEDFGAVETAFAAHKDAGVRRIGLALLASRAEATGWSADTREQLEAYRRDAAPFVAEAAALIFPPDAAPGEASGAQPSG